MSDGLDTGLADETGDTRALRDMIRVRRLEEACAQLYGAGKIRGFLHLYVGEEAVAAGILPLLGPRDAIVATYREHGQALLRGVSAGAILAEMFGKAEGCSHGRGGSMHLFDASRRFFGGNAIVGGGLPLAVGLALADRLAGRPQVTVCFFGDGAFAEGAFHESANLAALWKLPVMFVCENNLYAMGTRIDRALASTNLAEQAASYGMTSIATDGMDVHAVADAARRALTVVRSGRGPVFLEARTYRFRAHSAFDPELYRDRHELEEWRKRDPIEALARDVAPALRSQIEHEADAEIRAAIEIADAGTPEPIARLLEGVYAPSPLPEGTIGGEKRRLTYREAVRQSLHRALDEDERVFLMGEDVGKYGGCYAVTKGFLEEFGAERIRDTPLSEGAFAGAGIGAALGGLKPIVEIMTVNFSLLALDQIVNNAATLRHMSGEQLEVPVVFRIPTGAGRQVAAQHSHSFEGWYAHIPGIKVLAPATVSDAFAMPLAALADPNPVLIFEHASLYNMEGEIDPAQPIADVWRAAVRRPGTAITILAYGAMLWRALAAAEKLAAAGIDAEVLDLRVLRPLDDDTILASVKKTHRVVIVDEGWRSGGISAELAARISERVFFDLEAPIERVCTAEVPIPYAKHLEEAALPSVESIVAAATRAVTGHE